MEAKAKKDADEAKKEANRAKREAKKKEAEDAKERNRKKEVESVNLDHLIAKAKDAREEYDSETQTLETPEVTLTRVGMMR